MFNYTCDDSIKLKIWICDIKTFHLTQYQITHFILYTSGDLLSSLVMLEKSKTIKQFLSLYLLRFLLNLTVNITVHYTDTSDQWEH